MKIHGKHSIKFRYKVFDEKAWMMDTLFKKEEA
jgi:hypothetical protein